MHVAWCTYHCDCTLAPGQQSDGPYNEYLKRRRVVNLIAAYPQYDEVFRNCVGPNIGCPFILIPVYMYNVYLMLMHGSSSGNAIRKLNFVALKHCYNIFVMAENGAGVSDGANVRLTVCAADDCYKFCKLFSRLRWPIKLTGISYSCSC